ncbi:MAG: ATP synthase F1 subunit epsilon [Alphaproteobacteria bacterium]|nr:ATP synthase F1 subunit epsilon [Alphaproteobacteria bacterium]
MTENTQTFPFELVSPEEKLLSQPAVMAVVPGEEGDIGVLPDHSPVLSSVRPGVVAVYTDGKEEPRRIFVGGGFADISAAGCTILAEEAVPVEDLDEGALRHRLHDLTEDLTLVEGAADTARIERAVMLTKAKLEALSGEVVL